METTQVVVSPYRDIHINPCQSTAK